MLTNVALPRHQVHHATAHWTLELATRVREVFKLPVEKASNSALSLLTSAFMIKNLYYDVRALKHCK